MIYTGLLSLSLAEYAANQKCSAVLLGSADSIYPSTGRYPHLLLSECAGYHLSIDICCRCTRLAANQLDAAVVVDRWDRDGLTDTRL